MICVAALVGPLSSVAVAGQDRVLLVTEARAFVHESIPMAREFITSLGKRSRRYDVIPLRGGAAQLTSARLRGADAVVFANTSGELPLPDKGALLRFVRRGGAFVGTHSATDTMHSWPGFTRLVGAEFERHGALQEGRLITSRPAHYITRGVPRVTAWTDEFYEFEGALQPRTRVLIRLEANSVPDASRSHVPLVWTRHFGKGRVFYDALGHVPNAWTTPGLQRRLVARGIRWALAGSG